MEGGDRGGRKWRGKREVVGMDGIDGKVGIEG